MLPTAMRETIQGLWIGPRLSTMERLSIASFLHHGHPYHLYVYGDVEGVPPGAELRDGNEILPAATVFLYPRHESYSGFSNFFRYKLLLERGGWWVDSDVVCLRPFDFSAEHVFASEPAEDGEVAATAVLKAPAGSAVMARAWSACQAKDVSRLAWGETGPRLLAELIQALSLEDCRLPSAVFCPLSYHRWREFLEPDGATVGEAHAVHLWHEKWRRAGVDKDARFPAGCLYERLKQFYLA
jgi:Glycosyltransferase sugar-binding region containing DXD motif